MSSTRYIRAPEGTKYLKDIFTDGLLPQNCVFNKVLTGCGGSYVALTSPEPYIIAVPTKALVRDKVTSPTYESYQIQGISEEYPIGKRWLHLYDKIIVTYKSLPALAEKVDISRYNLLVDEVHMLTAMSGYARESLIWIMENFKRFKSYCFMSATVPRTEHLLPELRGLPKVNIIWEDVAKVDFNCLVSSDLNSSLLRIMLDHYNKNAEGTPYFFYNSVAGICNVIKKWQSSDYPATFNVICANTKDNVKKLKAVKQTIGKPNRKADFHFITATAFEGVDFFDPDGKTYVVSNRLYSSTKYSIETTIPQIVGRLRDSKFNSQVTVLFNEHSAVIDMTPREFSEYQDNLEGGARASVQVYMDIRERYLKDSDLASSLRHLLKGILEDPYVLVEGTLSEFEDVLSPSILEETPDVFPPASFYPYARTLAEQTYDLFHEQRYVRGEDVTDRARTLSEISGKAPLLSDEDANKFKAKVLAVKDVIALYVEDKEGCQRTYPEWYPIIDKLGVKVANAYHKDKSALKNLYKAALAEESSATFEKISRDFKPGDVYTAAYIKEYLQSLGITNAKATTLSKWYVIKRVVKNGTSCYRIIQRLTDTLVN